MDSEPPYLGDSDGTEAPTGDDMAAAEEDEEVEELMAVKCVFGTVEGCKTILRSSVPSSEYKSH